MRENPLRRKLVMAIERYKPEQIVILLRQMEVGCWKQIMVLQWNLDNASELT
jgi:hypothetical protein